ncbi:MAG: fluoride efflux transporter CrcB [Ahniella sp.]|nr:fluoride efflux transporter CrcB [Ahniella sp.]
MTGWQGLLPVAAGGALGASLRYGVAMWLPVQTAAGRFPWATLIVNLLGCALAGALYAWLQRAPETREFWRLLLMVGVLGGFTTFSAFGLETFHLLRQGAFGLASAYVLASVAGSLLVLVLAYRLSIT